MKTDTAMTEHILVGRGRELTMPQATHGAIVGQASLFAIDMKTRKPQRP